MYPTATVASEDGLPAWRRLHRGPGWGSRVGLPRPLPGPLPDALPACEFSRRTGGGAGGGGGGRPGALQHAQVEWGLCTPRPGRVRGRPRPVGYGRRPSEGIWGRRVWAGHVHRHTGRLTDTRTRTRIRTRIQTRTHTRTHIHTYMHIQFDFETKPEDEYTYRKKLYIRFQPLPQGTCHRRRFATWPPPTISSTTSTSRRRRWPRPSRRPLTRATARSTLSTSSPASKTFTSRRRERIEYKLRTGWRLRDRYGFIFEFYHYSVYLFVCFIYFIYLFLRGPLFAFFACVCLIVIIKIFYFFT